MDNLKSLKQILDQQQFDETVDNISNMPKRMEKGLSLVYPEKQLPFLEFLIDEAYDLDGIIIDTALKIMQYLEYGMSVEDITSLLAYPQDIPFAAAVNGIVLECSKRGPEYFKATLTFPYDELLPQTKNDVARLEQENLIYEANAKKRANGITHRR